MELNNQRLQSQSRDHVSLEIVTSNEELVTSIKEKMETIVPSLCIYRAPENLRKDNENAYTPLEVSIGPYHHGNQSLEPMEEHKWRYLNAVLSRKPNIEDVEASLDDCVKAMRELEHKARKCYQGSVSLNTNQFVEMMIVDGCFIIELFLRYSTKSLRRRGDHIFEKKGMLFSLRCDMILLENQLPFFVIERLFSLVPVPKQSSLPLIELAFKFFKIMLPGDIKILHDRFCQPGNHLLDFVRNCFHPYSLMIPPKQNGARRPAIHPVEQLQESGVKFKRGVTESLLDIEFAHGVLKIPPIKIHNYTDPLLRNLIALEHCSDDPTRHVSSYAVLMGDLIQSTKDVQLLHQKRIIFNGFDTDEEVSLLFSKLCKVVDVKDFYYAGLCDKVNAYSGWWATLKRNFMKSKRTRYVIIFAMVLIVLTIIATAFSVLSFYLHRK